MADRMTTGVVVGVDGSSGSEVAVRWAAAEAAMRKLELTVVHVLQFPTVGWSGWGLTMTPIPQAFFDAQEADARRIVADAVRVAKEAVGDSADTVIHSDIYYLPPVPTLLAASKDAELIVVGCRGQGGLQRVLMGSVSTALVHRAHCPVAVIHDELTPRPDMPVLVGVDGSPASEAAIAMAFDEASWRGVGLVALHACSDAEWPDYAGLDQATVMAEGDETLAEHLADCRERHPDVEVRRIVVPDHPAHHLLDEADSSQLVVVGSHGRGMLGNLLLGSVSNAVVHGARIPVLVARPR